MELFAAAPPELGAKEVPGAVTFELRPYLVVPGTGDVARVATVIAAAVLTARVFGGVVVLVGGQIVPVGLVLAGLVAAAGTTWIGVRAVRDWRRHEQTLTLTVTPEALALQWGAGGVERVALARVGRVDVVEAGYQRWHVVAQVAGAEPVRIPMERLPRETTAWFAERLADAGRRARGTTAPSPSGRGLG